jgi:protein-tyrosine-phosphatase
MPNATHSPAILFVCYGNIMRSAFAEACFRQEVSRRPALQRIRFASAGVRAYPDDRAEPHARAMASRLGYTLESHRAQRTSRPLLAQFDRVYIMDQLNEDLILSDSPEVREKVAYLSSLVPGTPKEIEDPYCQTDKQLEACFRRIELAVRNLAEELDSL